MIGNILFPPNSHQMGNMKKSSTSLMGRGGLFLKGKRSLASEKRTFFPLYSFGPGGSNHAYDHHAWFNHGVLEKDQLWPFTFDLHLQ